MPVEEVYCFNCGEEHTEYYSDSEDYPGKVIDDCGNCEENIADSHQNKRRKKRRKDETLVQMYRDIEDVKEQLKIVISRLEELEKQFY